MIIFSLSKQKIQKWKKIYAFLPRFYRSFVRSNNWYNGQIPISISCSLLILLKKYLSNFFNPSFAKIAESKMLIMVVFCCLKGPGRSGETGLPCDGACCILTGWAGFWICQQCWRTHQTRPPSPHLFQSAAYWQISKRLERGKCRKNE